MCDRTAVAAARKEAQAALAAKVRFCNDFPAPGILFQDLTPVLADAHAFRAIVKATAAAAKDMGAEMIGGLDARGFLLGAAAANELGLGILAIRKKGKLPPPVHSEAYELEYGSAALEIPAEGIDITGRRVVLVDDVLATGGTLVAGRKLLEKSGAIYAGSVVVLEVPVLSGAQRLADAPLEVINRP